jgi:cytidine deaminase
MMQSLLDAAWKARENACCGFSHFAVGAAIETADGHIYSGCNIENASYGLTVCAERVAIWKALSEGVREFRQIVVVTDASTLTPPCGACRQIIWEYCRDIPVTAANRKNSRTWRMSELLPDAFAVDNLK